LSLEGRELKAKTSILRRHGRMTAEEESRKTKQEQDEGRHRPRFLDYMVMKIKPLSANIGEPQDQFCSWIPGPFLYDLIIYPLRDSSVTRWNEVPKFATDSRRADFGPNYSILDCISR
jgi:hypothetical protein